MMMKGVLPVRLKLQHFLHVSGGIKKWPSRTTLPLACRVAPLRMLTRHLLEHPGSQAADCARTGGFHDVAQTSSAEGSRSDTERAATPTTCKDFILHPT